MILVLVLMIFFAIISFIDTLLIDMGFFAPKKKERYICPVEKLVNSLGYTMEDYHSSPDPSCRNAMIKEFKNVKKGQRYYKDIDVPMELDRFAILLRKFPSKVNEDVLRYIGLLK